MASLMVVLVVAGLGVCLVRLHAASTRRQVGAIDKKRALYVAEAGLSEAYMAMMQGKRGNVGTEQIPAAFGDGVYWVEAEPTLDGNVTLRSTGLCGVGRFSLSVVLTPHVDPIASLGIFSDSSLTVEPGVVIDGYESVEGPYEEQVAESGNGEHTGGDALLNSNLDILLEGGGEPLPEGQSTEIWGDLHPGPAGSVLIEPGVAVSGATTPSNVYAVMPEIEVPADAPAGGDVVVAAGMILGVAWQQTHLETLTLQSDARFGLIGPLSLIVDQLIAEPGAQVHFDTSDGPIVVIVT